MKYLLDASALVELFLRLEAEELVNILRDCCILDLTVYEFCNALWKLAKIRKRISEKTAISGAKLLEKIISGKGIVVISELTKLDDKMKSSLKHYINVYDISYIHVAREKNLTLITEDSGMHTNARNLFNLEVLYVDEFLKLFNEN